MKKFLLAPLLVLLLIFSLTSCIDGKGVVVFGDSLVDQSRASLVQQAPGITVNAFGGTAVCDWKDRMKATADTQPKVVIASFVGNSGRCAGIGNTPEYWRNMFFSVYDISSYYNAHHVELWWAGYPVGGPSIYPFVQFWEKVQSNYKYAAASFPNYIHWFDAGLTVAPNHVYTCCIDGKTVRQSDNLHLTPLGGQMYATELLKPAIN